MPVLKLLDAHTRSDLGTYLARARALDTDGAVRLQVDGTALGVWVGVLSGRSLSGDGTTLGLRVLRLAAPARIDVVVPLAAVGDRLARGDSTSLDVPPQEVRAGWASVSPPRGGWQQIADLSMSDIESVAREGIREIATGSPEGSGAAAVDGLRRRVWARPMVARGAADGLPAAVAFAAYALGFAVGDRATVSVSGRWYRVSTPVGHVLVR